MVGLTHRAVVAPGVGQGGPRHTPGVTGRVGQGHRLEKRLAIGRIAGLALRDPLLGREITTALVPVGLERREQRERLVEPAQRLARRHGPEGVAPRQFGVVQRGAPFPRHQEVVGQERGGGRPAGAVLEGAGDLGVHQSLAGRRQGVVEGMAEQGMGEDVPVTVPRGFAGEPRARLSR